MQLAGDAVYPRGGWRRALRYMAYRLRRLPDPAHKIARGISAGVFTSFTPFFGLHFLIAVGVAWMLRGNVIAALLGTFVGNPLTLPIIAGVSVELGSWALGATYSMPLTQTVGAFSDVSVELWENTRAVFTGEVAHWGQVIDFMDRVFLPYLVGGVPLGILAGIVAYAISRPTLGAYQKARAGVMRKRLEKRRAEVAARVEAAAAAVASRTAATVPASRRKPRRTSPFKPASKGPT